VIVDLEDWDAWNLPVPTGCLSVSFPIEDGDQVDPGVRQVAAFTASLVRADRRVLVHCTEGLNRALSNEAFAGWLLAEEERAAPAR
jgi:hypothetical protein